MPDARDQPIPMTAAGRAALEAELADLVAARPALVERVASARSDGDLKENFAYHDARRDLGMADGRAQTIEAILHNAVVVEEVVGDGSVGVGSRVVVADEFGETTYEVVGPTEVDLAKGRISMASPMGAALMGKQAGDAVTFSAPGGERTATVVRVGD